MNSYKIRIPIGIINNDIGISYNSQTEIDLKELFEEIIRRLKYSGNSEGDELPIIEKPTARFQKSDELEKSLVDCKDYDAVVWIYKKKDSPVNYKCWLCGRYVPGGTDEHHFFEDHRKWNFVKFANVPFKKLKI
jgi:hypothetical protein